MSRKIVFKSRFGVFLVMAVLCVAICSYAKWQAFRAREDAELLILDLRNLRVRESTLEDVNRIAANHSRYRRSLIGPAPPVCKDKDEVCYFDFGYENSLLARLRLASIVRFGARVQVYQHRVDVIMIGLTCGDGAGMAAVDLNEGLQPFTQHTLETGEFSNNRNGTWIRLTPNAPERDRAYSLNLKCFDHIGRCPDKGELLPAMANEVTAH
jgi:hypothetical protein